MFLQVHADASAFEEGLTKEEAYQQVLEQAEGLFEDQRKWVRAPPFTISETVCASRS